MGKQAKLKKKAKGFGKKEDLTVSFGAMVDGETANMPGKGSLLEFTAIKAKHTISGYVYPTIGKTGEINVQWLVTAIGDTPMDNAKAMVDECYKKHGKEAGNAVKQRLQESDVLFVDRC